MNLQPPPDSYWDQDGPSEDIEYDEYDQPIVVEADPDQAWKEREDQ